MKKKEPHVFFMRDNEVAYIDKFGYVRDDGRDLVLLPDWDANVLAYNFGGEKYVTYAQYEELLNRIKGMKESTPCTCRQFSPEKVADYISEKDLTVEQKDGATRIYKEMPKFEVDYTATKE